MEDLERLVNLRLGRRDLLKLAAVSAASAYLGAGCAPAPTATGPVKIVLCTGKDVSGANPKLVEMFNAARKDIQIDYQEMPPSTTEQHDKYATVFAAKDASIDIIAADIPWAPEFASAGWLLELEKMSGYEDIRKEYFEGPLLGTTYKGHVYAIPWFNNAGVLYWRTDILDKAGVKPPETFDELVDICLKLQKPPDLHGFVWQGFQYEGLVCDWLEYLWGFGGDFWDPVAEKVLVDSPEGVASVQFMVDMIHKHKISPESVLTFKETESYNVFQGQSAIFLRGWPSFFATANKDDSKVKGVTGIKSMPCAPGKKPGATLGTWNLAISKFSKYPQQAWEVVKYFTTVDAQKVKALVGGNPPARKAVYTDKEVLEKYPHFAAMSAVMNTALPRPVTPAYPQISAEAIQVNLTAALSKKITAQVAVKNMKAQTEEILSKFKK
jgi:multiple sugar transport system substrate-binding protein